MGITKLSIKRPVALLMVILIVILLGVVSVTNLPLDLMPSMNIPYMIVMTTYDGAGSYEVESMVTRPLESVIATVQNMKSLQSISMEGSSIIVVEFADGTDLDVAALNLRERVDMVTAMLPDAVGTPAYMKMDIGAYAIATISVDAPHLNANELKEMVADKIQPRLERLEGIASISLMGGSDREVKVTLDPAKLAGLNLSSTQIVQSLAIENFNQAGGQVDYGTEQTFSVRSMGEFTSIEQIRKLPILLATGGVIYLEDVAKIEEVNKEIATYARINGNDTILLDIQKATDTNAVEAMRNVQKELEKLKADYPELSFNVFNDTSEFIERSLGNVTTNMVVGGALAIFVIFIFLRHIGMTFVIALSIPISVIATFVMIYFSGTTLNVISLGGLALGVGLLIDNSIVVLESIYRKRLGGQDRYTASLEGTKEVGGAITASTLTTVMVFLPIVFVTGFIIQIFKDLALTVSFSLLSSLAVAVTLVPMLASKLVRNIDSADAPKKNNIISKLLGLWARAIQRLDDIYRVILAWALRFKKTVIFIALSSFIVSMCLIPLVGMEFLPASDEGMLQVNVSLKEGTKLEETDSIVREIEEAMIGIPEIEHVISSVGSGGVMGTSSVSNEAIVAVMMKPINDRTRSTSEVAEEIRQTLKNMSGAEINVQELSSMMGSFGAAGLSYSLSGPEYDVLGEIADQMVLAMSEVEGVREPTSSLEQGKPEVRITVDRDKAASYGLSSYEVASGIRLALSGEVATKLKQDGIEIDVRLVYPETTRRSLEELESVTISSRIGGNIPLSAVANISLEEGPVQIMRMNQERYIDISCTVYGKDVNSVNTDVRAILDSFKLPDGYQLIETGQMEMLTDSFMSLIYMLLLAILLVYMVMAAQFESLLYPFIIMFSVPLALTGAVAILLITGVTLSTPALLGVVMLAGIVLNNAIVLVDYINFLRRENGMNVKDAIMMAGPVRLRPILMTAMSTILALTPLAFAFSEGSELQRPLALVVMGGLITSTFLTLIVIPVMYVYMTRLAEIIRSKTRFDKLVARDVLNDNT